MSEHQFTPEEVAAIQAAIRAAGNAMADYRKAARVDPEKMAQPITPPNRAYPSHDMNYTKPPEREPFRVVLARLLNGECMENGSNTPDWILADCLHSVLNAVDSAIAQRDKWYGVKLEPGVHRCREYDWENGEPVTINVGAIFKIGKRLWRLIGLPGKEQGDDLWHFQSTEPSAETRGGCPLDRLFTRSEVQWLYSHGAFVGQPVDAEGAVL